MSSETGFEAAGKRVLVTGSTAGLGSELARGFARRGAIVGVCGRRGDRLDAVLAEVQSDSPRSRGWQVDLSDLEGLEGFADRVLDDLGGVDVVVHNAGMPKRRWAWQHRPDEVADVLRLNVESPIRLTLALLGALEATHGHLVFVGSVAARLSPPAEAVYAASKAAITTFAECLRVDLGVAGSSVGVHVVQPGVLDTDLFTHADNDVSISDIEPLPPAAIVDPVLRALASGAVETFVPGWFVDLPPVKVEDPDGFLDGAVDYTRQRLDALGRDLPAVPGGAP